MHSITHISICICTFSLPKSTILHHSHVISQHHTFSITQESLCLYLYLHLYTFITKIQNHTVPVKSSPIKPQPLSVRTGHPHFHPIWLLSFHLEGTLLSRCPFIRYAWMQTKTWDHVIFFAMLHTSQQDLTDKVQKTPLRFFGTHHIWDIRLFLWDTIFYL